MVSRNLGFLFPAYSYPRLWQAGYFIDRTDVTINNYSIKKSPILFPTEPELVPTEPVKNLPRAIVIDIDETLVSTTNNSRQPKALDESFFGRTYVINTGSGKAWGVVRPHCRDFLTYCRNNFDYVFIWTAGQEEYANAMVDHMFDDLGFQPDAVYNRNHCHVISGQYCKPLSVVCKEWDLDVKDVIIVDNNPTVIVPENQNNLIQIPDYEPRFSREDIDTHLYKLMAWFDQKPFYDGDAHSVQKDNIFA